MKRHILASIAAFAMMTGHALAQDSSTTTTTTTTVPSVPAQTYSTTKSQKTIDSMGTETDKSSSYSTDGVGAKSSSDSQTTGPDGSVIDSTHEEKSSSPLGSSSTTSHSSTTTTTTP